MLSHAKLPDAEKRMASQLGVILPPFRYKTSGNHNGAVKHMTSPHVTISIKRRKQVWWRSVHFLIEQGVGTEAASLTVFLPCWMKLDDCQLHVLRNSWCVTTRNCWCCLYCGDSGFHWLEISPDWASNLWHQTRLSLGVLGTTRVCYLRRRAASW